MGTVVQLWFQAKMYRTAAAILLLCGLVQSYPSGAPSCTSTPGHGTNNGQVCAVVKDIGNDKWEVHVAAFHKGLVINAETAADEGNRRKDEERKVFLVGRPDEPESGKMDINDSKCIKIT